MNKGELSGILNAVQWDQPTVLLNETCPYCGVALNVGNQSKEHVFGRRFVPKGKLKSSWNLILRACRRCNIQKSGLENDISAISMQPDSAGRHAVSDPALVAEGARKAAKSISARTRRTVASSAETDRLELQLGGGLRVAFNLQAPPQVDDDRVFRLAKMHVGAVFYFLTYSLEQRRGRFWRGTFLGANAAMRADWGNPHQRYFMNLVHRWEPRLLTGSEALAEGFAKICIRKINEDASVWSWAVEWNHNLRAVGFFGNLDTIKSVLSALPDMRGELIGDVNANHVLLRREVPLSPEEDKLFHFGDD